MGGILWGLEPGGWDDGAMRAVALLSSAVCWGAAVQASQANSRPGGMGAAVVRKLLGKAVGAVGLLVLVQRLAGGNRQAAIGHHNGVGVLRPGRDVCVWVGGWVGIVGTCQSLAHGMCAHCKAEAELGFIGPQPPPLTSCMGKAVDSCSRMSCWSPPNFLRYSRRAPSNWLKRNHPTDQSELSVGRLWLCPPGSGQPCPLCGCVLRCAGHLP